MKLLKWLKGSFSNRRRALSLYRRGMLSATRHDNSQAIDDYTTVIETSNTPPDVRAMALYNRALVHAASGDQARAASDLQEILRGGESPSNVRAAARQKIVRMNRQPRSTDV